MKQEEALVLLLGRLSFDQLTKVRIFHLIKNGIDWYEFLNICIKKKLICLVYKNLVDLGLIQLLPMIIINNMQYHYEQNQEQNQKLLQASAPVISYFENNNILAIPVKGLRFLNTIYRKEPGVRILSDVDYIASASDRSIIHDFMKKSGYDVYLINNQDAFCSTDSSIQSFYYIKFEGENFYGKLRVDFDFKYPDDWIKLIQSSEQPVYEFLYLCNTYYYETYNKIELSNIGSYNYLKLIDIHEYCSEYLSAYSIGEILTYADEMNVREQALFTITCLNNLYINVFHI